MKYSTSTWGDKPRAGLVDIWNSTLYENAQWTELDNPVVASTVQAVPTSIVPWHEAKRIHKRNIAKGSPDYHIDAFIHCYLDDHKFDGEREGIWKKWKFFYEVARHFDGILGIDFSTYADFPEPVKRFQFHKMRVIEHGAVQRGIPTIPNARWGTPETWSYCYDSLPEDSMLSVGVVGSGLGNIENRPMFDAGMRKLIELKHPTKLVVIGSTSYPIFDEVRMLGIAVVQFDGETCSHFKSKVSCHV